MAAIDMGGASRIGSTGASLRGARAVSAGLGRFKSASRDGGADEWRSLAGWSVFVFIGGDRLLLVTKNWAIGYYRLLPVTKMGVSVTKGD